MFVLRVQSLHFLLSMILFSCASTTTSLDSGWFVGKIYEDFALSGRGALCIHPLISYGLVHQIIILVDFFFGEVVRIIALYSCISGTC